MWGGSRGSPSAAVGQRLHIDYEHWTDLESDLHTGVPTGTDLDVIGARARISSEWDFTVTEKAVLIGRGG